MTHVEALPRGCHPLLRAIGRRPLPAQRHRAISAACCSNVQKREDGRCGTAASTPESCTRQREADQTLAINTGRKPTALAAALATVVTALDAPGARAVGDGALSAVTAAQSAAPVYVPGTVYVPGPVEVGWEIYVGAAACVSVFALGAWEFVKRILIQRRCEVCGGSGLVHRGAGQRKCPQCGGFFPWISWRQFLSANARPGNGGPLLQPKGQRSVLYRVPEKTVAGPARGEQSSDSASESSK